MAQEPTVGQGPPPIIEYSWSHLNTHHSRQDSSGRAISATQILLPDITQHSQKTDIHALGGIRTRNPSKWAAADLRLTPCGHWDRHMKHYKHLVHLVGFTIGIYYGARPYGRQINIKLSSQLRLLTVSFHFSPSIDGLLSSPFSANSSCTFLWSSSFPSLQKPSAVGHISRVLFLWFSRNT